MSDISIQFKLKFEGALADQHAIDFYDVSIALLGFQRSLAITTHFILNGDVITQAPSLKGATIIARPPQIGSWEFLTDILPAISPAASLAAAGYLLSRPKDTPLGNLVSSAYDFIISRTMGFHVDYEKSLSQQYDELKRSGGDIPKLEEKRFDSVIEKCESAIVDMHRPIVKSKSATMAKIYRSRKDQLEPLKYGLNYQTYLNVKYIKEVFEPQNFLGKVSSYNVNTFVGRVYVPALKRTIPFELEEGLRRPGVVDFITTSLKANAKAQFEDEGLIGFAASTNESRTGVIKKFLVIDVWPVKNTS